MSDWSDSSKHRSGPTQLLPVIELLVIEGEDSGRRFTVDEHRVDIGRGTPRSGRPGAVLLSDPTVSILQAVIHTSADGTVLQHEPEATNWTLVNDELISSQLIHAGDRIRMGGVVLEVRDRKGLALAGLMESSGERMGSTAWAESTELTGDTTEARIRKGIGYYLIQITGDPNSPRNEYPVCPPMATIGRHANSDVCIRVGSVSRRHAEIRWQAGRILLIHRSRVNQTCLNGVPIVEPVEISAGDEIQLADQVVFHLIHKGPDSVPSSSCLLPPLSPEEPSLLSRMEEKIRIDRQLEEQFSVTGSFLDIDVVAAIEMKQHPNRPDQIVVSFECWRSWAGGIVERFDGMVLNSNGYELMCFFDSPTKCVQAASEILAGLDAFNRDENLLDSPFRLRAGIHTGSSLLDRSRGVAYSSVLDIAAHLQMDANVNELLISEDTLRVLPESMPFDKAGELDEEGIATYRLTKPIV